MLDGWGAQTLLKWSRINVNILKMQKLYTINYVYVSIVGLEKSIKEIIKLNLQKLKIIQKNYQNIFKKH